MLSQSPQQVKISPTHAGQGNGRSGNGLLNTAITAAITHCMCIEKRSLVEILAHKKTHKNLFTFFYLLL